MEVIDKNSAQSTGRSHQAVTNNIARMIGLAAAKFLESLAHQLNRKLTKVVEVKINDKLVFRGEPDRKPEINKFTPEHIKLIESLLPTSKVRSQEKSPDTPRSLTQVVAANHLSPQMSEYLNTVITNAKARLEPEKINAIQILVGGQSVYHSKDGNELVNQLNSTPQASKDTGSQVEPSPDITNNGQVDVDSNFNQQQLNQNVNHLSIIAAANRILEAKGVDKFEHKLYSIERSNNNLVVTANDGRGEIAKLDSVGQVSGKDLLPGETKIFSQAANKFESQIASAKASKEAEQAAISVEESEQEQSVATPKVQVATASKDEPDEDLEI